MTAVFSIGRTAFSAWVPMLQRWHGLVFRRRSSRLGTSLAFQCLPMRQTRLLPATKPVIFRLLPFFSAIVLLVATAEGSRAQEVISGPPVFRVGDVVRVSVWNNLAGGINPLLSGDFPIGEDGTVIHPLYRAIQIAGMSLSQAEAEFRRVLMRFEGNPELVIEPLFQVAVNGAVGVPNIYALPPYATVAAAIAQAGGPLENADLRRIRLLREGRETVLDLRQPDSEFANISVRSGDHIIVETDVRIWRDRIEPAIRTVGSLASIAILFIQLSDQFGQE